MDNNTINCFGVSTAFAYNLGEAPVELISNDILKNTLKPALGLSGYGVLARVSKTFQKKIQPILDAEWNQILKAITFGRDKWLNIPGVITVSDEPPLTKDQVEGLKAKFRGTCQVFNEPDPIQPHRFQNDKVKKTWQTHMLIFFPEFINDDPRTLNVIGRLFRFEREGDNPTVFEYIPGNDGVEFRNMSASGSYWRWVPRDVFPGSRRTLHDRKVEIVTSKGCIVPSPIDAATAVLIMNLDHSHEDGDYFFCRGRNGELWTYTVTDGEFDGWKLVVGAAALSGLFVRDSADGNASVGIAGFAEVL
jgi:hypothetical protein